MILSLNVRNVLGFNYDLNLNSGNREKNNFKVKEHNLFATYQITNSVDGELGSYKKITTAFTILKLINSPYFKSYCSTIKSVCSIDISFIIMDAQSHTFKNAKYSVLLSKEGILEEYINGTPVLKMKTDPYASFIPSEYTDYFEVSLFSYDLEDKLCVEDLAKVFNKAVSLVAFVKFLVKFLKLAGFNPLNVIKDEYSEIKVEYPDGKIIDLADEAPSFKAVCLISWVAYTVLIKTGIVVFNNLDKVLGYATIHNIVELFNNAKQLNLNTAQLLFTSSDIDYSLYPEQVMEVYKKDNLTYCMWQNF